VAIVDQTVVGGVPVGATEAAKLKAARDKEAALAKQEAALMAQGVVPAAAPAKTSAKPAVKAFTKKKKVK